MRVMSVVGARPELIKIAPVSEAFAQSRHEHLIVHTGQHYDEAMSQRFVDELGLPEPDVELGVGSARHGRQTGQMLEAIESSLLDLTPDWVLVYGDTNSTLAGALAAAKLHIRVAHVEAGLRSFNRRMPEEHNRVLVDHASDLLLAPTAVAMANLRREGLGARAVAVGDLHADTTLRVSRQTANGPARIPGAGLDDGAPFLLATIHRAENTDDPARLGAVVGALAALPLPVVLPVHPRLRDRATGAGVGLAHGSLRPIAPLGYHAMIAAVQRSRAVITDSGGLQKECYLLRTPCTTVRTETEWTETLEGGWNVLCPDPRGLPEALCRPAPAVRDASPYGAGDTAVRIVGVLDARGDGT